MILGVLGGIWFTLAMWDGRRVVMRKKRSVVENREVKEKIAEQVSK